jgi:hypothetical protein
MPFIRLLVICCLLLWPTAICLAQDAPPDEPATPADAAGEEPKTEAPAGTKIKGKTTPFTLLVPEGWQYVAYDKPEDRPNAKIILQGGLNDKDTRPTDHFNFWWYEGEENLTLGLASFHRLETTKPHDAQGLLKGMSKRDLPNDTEVNPKQLGKYVGLIGGGVVQEVYYGAVLVIAQGNVVYMATIVGPQAAVAAQWETFGGLVASLDAPDLKPEKVEDFFVSPEPEGDAGQ